MTDRRSIVIRLDETHHSATSVRLQADLLLPHRGARGVRAISHKTITKTLNREFSDQLSPALMKELVEALTLVLKNWYETGELPFA